MIQKRLLYFNSFPNDKILDSSKFKAFADDKIIVTKIAKLYIDKVENIAEKGENAGCQHFLLFQQCFQRANSAGSLNLGTMITS